MPDGSTSPASQFNGAGDTLTPTWINLACFWALQVPVAWALAFPLGLGERGVYLSITIANLAAALLAAVLFRRGTWKGTMV